MAGTNSVKFFVAISSLGCGLDNSSHLGEGFDLDDVIFILLFMIQHVDKQNALLCGIPTSLIFSLCLFPSATNKFLNHY